MTEAIYNTKVFEIHQVELSAFDFDQVRSIFPDEVRHPASDVFVDVINVSGLSTVAYKLSYFKDSTKNHGLFLQAAQAGTPGIQYRLTSTAAIYLWDYVPDGGVEFTSDYAEYWADFKDLRPQAFLTCPPCVDIEFIGHTTDMDVLIIAWETRDDRAEWGRGQP
jgi:hypothetical protein